MGLIVTFEVIYIIKTGDGIVVDGVIQRTKIFTGWGVYNNLGAIIAMSIPFAFYFAATTKLCTLWLAIGTLLFGGVILSCSRGSIVAAVIIYALSLIVTFFTAKSKALFRISCVLMIAGIAVLGVMHREMLLKMFEKVPKILEKIDGEFVFNDSDRFKLYQSGIDAFKSSKIFGVTFFPIDYAIYDYATLEAFTSFFPPRWHNTVIQMLASSGIVGLIAYGLHRLDTVRIYIKRRNLSRAYYSNAFIALSIGALLLSSLLDCHLFNIGPTLFYSTMLAVMEHGLERKDC